MAEEATASVTETLAQPNAAAATSNEATIETATEAGTESTCNNSILDKPEASAVTSSSGGDREKTLEFADELMEKGDIAMKESDFGEASECFSRSLEIRVAHFGELAPQCVRTYYRYGCALLYKAQEEADPLGNVPKKEGESQQESVNVGPAKNVLNGESSTASVSSNADQVASPVHEEGAQDDGVSSGKDQEEDNEDSDVEDLAEGDEDESDLDLAWKMLDVARAIIEKQNSGDTMEKVEVLSALAEVALEREDFETSLSDYLNALSSLEKLVEPDNRRVAELNFRICLCLEIASKPDEAIPYCQKAISICKSRVRRLMIESKSFSESTASSSTSEDQLPSDATKSDNAMTDKQAEIQTLTELCGDLEKKLEDLQQLVSNPRNILADLLGMVSAKAKAAEKSASSAAVGSSQMGTANNNGGFDSPTISTAHTNGSSGVTHLGVVGRGVKRTLTNSGTEESDPGKKPALDRSESNGEGK
ncbi:uncharacterized protein LOC126805423 [Argentina anserina]|uniref:uncharacterized protein LOC126805423 n=1 Tax=Argentina anserina TaxID=57926 RepID=UPI0021767351|nr:uncharacterized protein LOC126805423 [Potentilla anserina]